MYVLRKDTEYSDEDKENIKSLYEVSKDYFTKKNADPVSDFREQKENEQRLYGLLGELLEVPFCLVFRFQKSDGSGSEITLFLSNQDIVVQMSCDNEFIYKALHTIFKKIGARPVQCNDMMGLSVALIGYAFSERYKKYLTDLDDGNTDIFAFLRRQLAGKFGCPEDSVGVRLVAANTTDPSEIAKMTPSQLMSGGHSGKHKYKGRSYKVRIGTRGGAYIVSQGNKIYISKTKK